MEKSKRVVVCIGTLLVSAIFGYAQSTINYGAGVGQRDVVFNSVPVADGNYVEIGYFTQGFDIAANAPNLTALSGAWHELDFTPIQHIFGQPGRFGANVSTTDGSFDGQKVALWLFKTSDNAAPASGFGNVSAFGIFSSTSANWIFPAQTAMPPNNTTTVASSEVNQAYWGTFDADTVNGHLNLAPVPEPTTYSLLALAGFVLLVAREKSRRRDKQAVREPQ